MNHKTLQDEKPLTAEVPELPISVRKKAEAMVNKSEKEDANMILKAAIRCLYVMLVCVPEKCILWDFLDRRKRKQGRPCVTAMKVLTLPAQNQFRRSL